MMSDGAKRSPRLTIELSGIGKVYNSSPPVAALYDINLSVNSADFVAVMGPSGCGKSTLLNLLGLLDRPTSGTYILNGVATTSLPENELTRLRATQIGFVFQSFHLLSRRSAIDNVGLGMAYRNVPRRLRKPKAAAALELVGLSHRMDSLASGLSGGERQRVAIARAVVGEPALLLADEPTGNLDSESTHGLMDLLSDLNSDGLTIVMVTHDDDVARRAGFVTRIRGGVLTGLNTQLDNLSEQPIYGNLPLNSLVP